MKQALEALIENNKQEIAANDQKIAALETANERQQTEIENLKAANGTIPVTSGTQGTMTTEFSTCKLSRKCTHYTQMFFFMVKNVFFC